MLTGPSDTHLVGISHDSTLLAVSVLTDRMQQLPDQDRDDLVELFKAICTAKQQGDSEGLESATLAVQEILEQGESGMQRIAPAATPPESIGPWIHWISGKIRTLRKEAGMTQEQLSERTGLPQSHISRLERGEHSPSASTLEKLARAFALPLHELDPSADPHP